ncbi:MAG: tetratricopeptide repeat protein [Treponema sp.]|jgi:tetratricopeptide (TPR) repeat protein|nr:tetratricopeptide repeat protein [Treponema sp.]
MKKFIIVIFFVIFALSCTTSPKKGYFSNIDKALDQAAEEINATLPQGKRLGIVKIDSDALELSSYLMEELTGRLVKIGKLTMVDRLNIEYVRNELSFQLSGEVSDESAQAIGKMLGAQSIAIGSLSKVSNNYRLRINIIEVESAVNEAAILLDVQGGRNYTTLFTALKEGKRVADVSYREEELARAPKTAIDYLNRGIMFALRLDFDTALLDFDDAIKLDRNMALAYLQRAKALFIRQVKRDVEIDPNFEFVFPFRLKRGKTNDDDRAIVDFNQAIELNPDLAGAWRYRGFLFEQIGEYDNAVSDYTQYIRRRPDDLEGYMRRGFTYQDMESYFKAEDDFTHIFNVDPNFARISYTLSYICCYIGDLAFKGGGYGLALQYYDKSRYYNENNARAHFGAANVYYTKEYGTAIDAYTLAINIDPNYHEAFFWRGMSYYALKDYNLAVDNFSKALKLDPLNEEYQKWLQIAKDISGRY